MGVKIVLVERGVDDMFVGKYNSYLELFERLTGKVFKDLRKDCSIKDSLQIMRDIINRAIAIKEGASIKI